MCNKDNLRRPHRLILAKPLVAAKFKDGYRYGVEVEVEGRGLPRGNDFYQNSASSGYAWATHDDGSLRGESCEYVFEKATPFNTAIKLVDNLFEEFQKRKTVLNPSNRTSSHVHVNVSGLKINQVNSFVVLWFTFEQAVINACGELRKNNHFCLSARESAAIPQRWYSALARGIYKFTNEHKYAALNFAALSRFGTLEFRCFPMPTSANDVSKWIKFLHGMKTLSVENYLDPTRIARDLSEKGSFEILRDICMAGGCPELADEIRAASSNFHGDCMAGFRSIQEAVFDYDWTDILPEFDREYVENPFQPAEAMAADFVNGGRPLRVRRRDMQGVFGEAREFQVEEMRVALRNIAERPAIGQFRIQPALPPLNEVDEEI